MNFNFFSSRIFKDEWCEFCFYFFFRDGQVEGGNLRMEVLDTE